MRLLEESQISLPSGSVANSSLPLTFFDIFWLYTSPVERIFLYRFPHPTVYFIESFLPKLKNSLSLSLEHFHPLAGKLRLSPNSDKQFELYYTDGDSVSFTVVECDEDFHDLIGSRECEFAKLHPLIPQLPKSDIGVPLLSIQVTLFPNHGICIGFSIQHIACDGFSSMSFIKSWATACRSTGSISFVAPPLSFDRSVIEDPQGFYSSWAEVILRTKTFNLEASTGNDACKDADIVSGVFTLRQHQIMRLKQWVQAKAEAGKSTFRCSTFVVASAYAWICLVKSGKFISDEISHLAFAVDWRGRSGDERLATYFGNCLGGCFVEAKVSDLIKEDGVVAACEAIGNSIEGLGDGMFDIMDAAIKKIEDVEQPQHHPLSIAGSPKFGVYDADFGWGKPQRVEVPSIRKSGAISLAESREEPGGVEVGLVLPKLEMEEFAANFVEGLRLY